jgi:hypothetical protein
VTDDDKMWTPVTAEDVTDGNLVAGQLRALQREVRSGFELVTNKLLHAIERIGNRLEDHSDRITALERRVGALESKK